MKNKEPKIGFIGQGWIGKHYADNFEERGHKVVRYALDPPHNKNKEEIKKCDVVFIAVPTPSTPKGFNFDALRATLKLIGKGNTAVIKSTVLPGTTEELQADNPDIFVMHSPEFLTEATAAYDAANPSRNIIGIPVESTEFREKAQIAMKVLPFSAYNLICSAKEAEMIKYGGNCWFYFKVIFINMLYDLAGNVDANWEVVRDAMSADPRIGRTHLDPVHKSGRGAGGHCFIKDFAAFSEQYKTRIDNPLGHDVLESLKRKNMRLLLESQKDIDLLEGVYGKEDIDKMRNELGIK